MTVEIAVSQPAALGESPVWSDLEQVLFWVDINGRDVHRYDPATGFDVVRPTLGRPGALALTTQPGVLLVAMEHQLVWFDWATGSHIPWIDLEEPGTGNRLNDGATDNNGRFVVGSMFEDTRADRTTGVLHQIDADGTTRQMRQGIGVTNGLAFDQSRDRMYFADTAKRTVWSYTYDIETGQATRPTVFFDYAHLPGKPDGGCVDADGFYWSASVRGSAILRISPNGVLERRIELPLQMPTKPCFGGPNLETLFITSIGNSAPGTASGSDAAARTRDSTFLAGQLLSIEMSDLGLGVSGRPETPFAGTAIPVDGGYLAT